MTSPIKSGDIILNQDQVSSMKRSLIKESVKMKPYLLKNQLTTTMQPNNLSSD